MGVRQIIGDCRQVLKTLPSNSVHCVVTSPPYWGLRDYGTAKWEGGDPGCDHQYDRTMGMRASTLGGGKSNQPAGSVYRDCPKCGARRIDSQIGLEPTFDQFIAEMVSVFREIRRVLRSDGTLWLNLGDSYAGAPSGGFEKGNRGTLSGKFRSNSAMNTAVGGLKPKDLCGIPWRVAFALQAPDYLGRIRREADRAWLAALVDGEGCISILETTSGRDSGPVSTSYPPILQVRMCDRECIDKAMELVGSEGENPAQHPPSQGGVRPSYQWRIHGRKAADTIAEIYPFLLIKRKQAIVAWNAQAAREGYETRRGVKIPAAAYEKQKLCREVIQKLNQREPVDLPSWMVEPPLPIGPGWYLRQDLIWAKPNPMPESVTDRCTKAHEYIFLLSKSARYFYDAEAIKEPLLDSSLERGYSAAYMAGPTEKMMAAPKEVRAKADWRTKETAYVPQSRNKRSVWEVATAPFSEAHFATFPPELIEPAIKAGCPKDGTVLDPFGGAGTTGLVADRLQRNAILIELNPTYANMSQRRIENDAPLFASVCS